jgi:protein-S-isoprenylcysteine O-methyltransferase Ste14
MTELLDALRIEGPLRRRLVAPAIWLTFGGIMVALAVGQSAVEHLLGLPGPVVVLDVIAVWGAWTVWHSLLFARHRNRWLASGLGYRRAFVVDIVPGITIGFSQMLRSAWNGGQPRGAWILPTPLSHPPGVSALVVGLIVTVAALWLFLSAWRVLGAARAGFVGEFVRPDGFVPERRLPYSHVRHPLFWSGIALSWGLAIMSGTGVGTAVAIVNAVYGLLYNRLEDRRLRMVFGDRYGKYAEEVPRIVPAGLWLRGSEAPSRSSR